MTRQAEIRMAIEVSKHMGLVIWRPKGVGTVGGPRMRGDVETQLMVGSIAVQSPVVTRVRSWFRLT